MRSEILHRAAPCRNVPVTFTLSLMRRLALIGSLALLSGCTDLEGLPLFADADRIEVGALKYMPVLAEVREGAAIARATRFANDRRSQRWSTVPVKHGCRSILLTFFRGKERIGYLAWAPTDMDSTRGAFYTNSTKGEVTRSASLAETSHFKALLPQDFKPRDC